MPRYSTVTSTLVLIASLVPHADAADAFRSHPPMRSLPVATSRAMGQGPAYYVDSKHGQDAQEGSQERPWRTIVRALRQVKAGDTLYLRGGTYYEKVLISLVGTPEKPITIRSYPGELAIMDAGYREFFENPAEAWEPAPHGAENEYRSTKSYPAGGGFGNFGDSMIPFHRYISIYDLRSANEFFHSGLGKRTIDPSGIYCGPGSYRDPESGRIHIRLAHTKLEGLGENAYRGETDPRKLALVVSAHDYALRIEGAKYLRIQDIVIRGAERSAVVIAEDAEDNEVDAENIELDGVTAYGSGSALRVSRTRGLRIVNCCFRGHTAPWHSRAHHKYRANAGYLAFVAGRDIEIAHSELTDHHDCIQIQHTDELRFHHNLVDNINDDAIEVGPKKERGRAYIYQNIISRCLNPFTLHGDKPAPVTAEPGSGFYIYRNIVDLRDGTYKTPPSEPNSSRKFLNMATVVIAHDHGSPTWPVSYVYQNTFLVHEPLFRGYYAFSWGSHLRGTSRRVFNNLFVQVDGLPGLSLAGVTPDDDFVSDGNLMWGVREGASQTGDFFAKFRASKTIEASKQKYTPGWGAHDLFADPKFVRFVESTKTPSDLRLQPNSPAINAGVQIPKEWPDPLRDQDQAAPDIGALPLNTAMLHVGPR